MLGGMGFRVVTDTTGTSDDYFDGSRYFIVDGFLVTVRPDDLRTTYSQAGWLRVEDDGVKIVRQDDFSSGS